MKQTEILLLTLGMSAIFILPALFAGEEDPNDREREHTKETGSTRYRLTDTLTADGSLRLRNESRDGYFDDNLPAGGDSVFLSRLRLNLDYQPSQTVRAFLEVQDARVFDGENLNDTVPNLNEDVLDLHQGYLDVNMDFGSNSLRVRAGRQKMNLGAKRIISSLGWSNTEVTWDGVRATVGHGEERRLDAFGYTGVPPDNGSFNDWADAGNRLFDSDYGGLYYTDEHTVSDGSLEGYLLYRENDDADDQVYTLGGRFEQAWGAWDTNAEVAGQIGTFGDIDHRGYAVHAEGGRTFSSINDTRLGVLYDYASGDDDPNDSTHGTFDNIYYIPLNHAYYGYMDFFSWQNLHHAAATARTNVANDWTVRLAYHSFWLAEEDSDAWYNASRGTVRNAGGQDVNSHVGSEVDLTLTHSFELEEREVALLVGYSHFFAGSYVNDTGSSDDADFLYLQTTIDF